MSDPDLLVLSLDFPPNDGGISRLAADAVSALGQAGAKIRVATFAANSQIGLVRPACEVVEIGRRKGLRDWQLIREIRSHLRRHGKGAQILATIWNPEATLAMLAGARRVTILAHGNEVMPYPHPGPKSLIRRIVLERARVVICNSRFTESFVRRIAPQARTEVLNPAVDTQRFAPRVPRAQARRFLGLPLVARVVLTVARLDPVKGHETVLRALAALSELQRARILYVIIGSGAMRRPLAAQVHALGLSDCVRFAGFVPDDDLLMWYTAADLCVMPSIVDTGRSAMEGFGMTLTEAQAVGLPVIGTRSGGIPDAVAEGDGGWLIDERDAQALADHLRRLIDQPEDFADQGRRAAARMRREMSWDGYARRLLELI